MVDFVLILWFFLAVTFSDEALSKGVAIGLAGGMGYSVPPRFPSLDPVSSFAADKPHGLIKSVTDGHHLTLLELNTDAMLTDDARTELPKPQFLFGDAMADPSVLLIKESRWLRVMEGTHYYLPSMPRGFSIVELQSLAVPIAMNWDLTLTQDGVTCGIFTGSTAGYGVESSCKRVTGLRPSLPFNEFPAGETIAVAETFRHRFFQAGWRFPPKDFRAPRRVYSAPSSDTWWSKITDYVLAENYDLKNSELYVAIQATRHGLRINASQFHDILELYCAESGTFFTPNGELGITLHEMYDVSGLPLGDFPYEEYVPSQDEIDQLSDHSPMVVETLWELLCHYHICLNTSGSVDHKGKKKRDPGISHKNWADYMFP